MEKIIISHPASMLGSDLPRSPALFMELSSCGQRFLHHRIQSFSVIAVRIRCPLFVVLRIQRDLVATSIVIGNRCDGIHGIHRKGGIVVVDFPGQTLSVFRIPNGVIRVRGGPSVSMPHPLLLRFPLDHAAVHTLQSVYRVAFVMQCEVNNSTHRGVGIS